MRLEIFKRELRELFRLGLPVAAAQAGAQLMGLVDVAVLGRYGARELAGSGLGNAIFFAVSIVGMGLVLGVDPLISQALGAGNRVRAHLLLWQGVWLALAVTAVLTVILVVGAASIPLIGASPELIRPARTYLLIRTMSLAPHLLFYVVRSYLQAHGITRPMIHAMIAANILNLGGDIVLVFGGGILPAWTGPLRKIPSMGVAGAAIATVACTFLQLAIVAAAVRKLNVAEEGDRRWNRAEIGKAFSVGAPVGLQMGAEIGIFALVALLAGRIGTTALAAHQLVIGVASFTFTVALGVSSAGSVRVGLGIGSRDPLATRYAGHATFLAGATVMGVSALAFTIMPRAIARIFTNDEGIIAAAMPLLLVAAVFQLSDGIQAAGAGVLRGAGDTRFALYANLIGHWTVGFPVAVLLGFHFGLGIVGLWWGLCAGLTVVAVLLFIRFEMLARRGIEPL